MRSAKFALNTGHRENYNHNVHYDILEFTKKRQENYNAVEPQTSSYIVPRYSTTEDSFYRSKRKAGGSKPMFYGLFSTKAK